MILHDATIYLAAATIAVVLARKLGFGAVLGYLIAGVLVGPWGLRLITDVESILHFAEIGVVFLLFIIGLELQPRRPLGDAASPGVRAGHAARLASPAVVLAAILALGFGSQLEWKTAVLFGFALALSSTAFVLQLLAERKGAQPRRMAGLLSAFCCFQDRRGDPLDRARAAAGPDVTSEHRQNGVYLGGRTHHG